MAHQPSQKTENFASGKGWTWEIIKITHEVCFDVAFEIHSKQLTQQQLCKVSSLKWDNNLVVLLNLWHCEEYPTFIEKWNLNHCLQQAVPLWVWLRHLWCCFFVVVFFPGMFSWLVCGEWHSLRWAEGRRAAGFNRAAGLGLCSQILQKHMGWHRAAAWRTGWKITWRFLAVAYLIGNADVSFTFNPILIKGHKEGLKKDLQETSSQYWNIQIWERKQVLVLSSTSIAMGKKQVLEVTIHKERGGKYQRNKFLCLFK